MTKNIFSNWVGADIRFIQPTDKYKENEVVKCTGVTGNMINIERDDGGRTFFRKDRFELVGVVKRRAINTVGHKRPQYEARKIHNDKTRLEALNNTKEWPDNDLLEIYKSEIDLSKTFPIEKIDDMTIKFKRTYFAVEEQIRVAESYKATGDLREFYYKERNKTELKKIGAQAIRLLNQIILEGGHNKK